MPDLVVVGVDVGFRRTGLSAIRLEANRDELYAATTVAPKPAKDSTSVARNVSDCWTMRDGIIAFIEEHKPTALFAEMPHGGSQGARAGYCMGMATGLILGTLAGLPDLAFELYSPMEVEVALGIKLAPSEAKKQGLKKGDAAKWKKERLRNVVVAEWPLFNGWPEKVEVQQDAMDSAAAFLCGRANNRLYANLDRLRKG